MKVALEALKDRQPRLPLPEGADSHSGLLPHAWGGGGGLGTFGRDASANGRDRSQQDSSNRMDDMLADASFWVVSRANNCLYCLGHQELKLRMAGLTDDTIAALDSDWHLFDARQRSALAFARTLTLEPYLIGGDDIGRLKEHFTDAEIIELSLDIARFNAANRWTDGLGLAQERYYTDEGERTFTTPTSQRFQNSPSLVTPGTRTSRPPLPTWPEIMKSISECHDGQARVALPNDETAAEALSAVLGDRKPFHWERAMATFAGSAALQVDTLNHIMTDEHLGERLKSELAFISAVNNHAWYAAGHALHRLRDADASTEQVMALLREDLDASRPSAAHRLAAKLTADPHLITDADIADVREHFNDSETAQILQVICIANLFDRFTQSLGLPLEEQICP